MYKMNTFKIHTGHAYLYTHTQKSFHCIPENAELMKP